MKNMSRQADHRDKQQPDTQARILNAAEMLFAERGYAATSLRAIASAADVNLAATHYHFGSKKHLLSTVFHRRIDPINEARLAGLASLKAASQPLTTRSIMAVFFGPLRSEAVVSHLPRMLGRVFSEPETISRPILEEQFMEVASAFLTELNAVHPDVTRSELQWRLHFVIGAMVQLLLIGTPLGTEPGRENPEDGLEHLLDFCVAGIEQPGHETGREELP